MTITITHLLKVSLLLICSFTFAGVTYTSSQFAQYYSGSNYCTSTHNIFSTTGINVAQDAAESAMSFTFTSAQSQYATASNRVTDYLCASQQINLNYGNNIDDQMIRIKVKVDKKVRILAFAAYDRSDVWTFADGGVGAQKVEAGEWVTLTFAVPDKTWDNKTVDFTKIIGWGIGIRDYDTGGKPSESITIKVDYIKMGSFTSDTGNEATNTDKGYTFQFSGGIEANCIGDKVAAGRSIGSSHLGYSFSSYLSGEFRVTTDGNQSDNFGHMPLDFYEGACQGKTIDLSDPANQQVRIKIKSDATIWQFHVFLVDENDKVANNVAYQGISQANKWYTLTFDMSDLSSSTGGNIDASKVKGIRLVIKGVSVSTNVDYIEIGDAVGQVDCQGATLSITNQPISRNVCIGDPSTLTLDASSSNGVKEYAWKKVGSSDTLSTADQYTIYSTGASNHGDYYCEVSNGCEVIYSDTVTIYDSSSIQITEQPMAIDGCLGATATLSIQANSVRSLDYSWRKVGSGIQSFNQNYQIATLNADRFGLYYCKIENSCTNAYSDTVEVTSSNSDITILLQPAATASACIDDTVTLVVSASSERPLSYQWLGDGGTRIVSEEATDDLVIADQSYFDDYYCSISNACHSVESNTFTVASCLITGTTDFQEQQELMIYPNPFSDRLFIDLGMDQAITYTLYSMDGEIVDQGLLTEQELSLAPSLPSGGYFLEVIHQGEALRTFVLKK